MHAVNQATHTIRVCALTCIFAISCIGGPVVNISVSGVMHPFVGMQLMILNCTPRLTKRSPSTMCFCSNSPALEFDRAVDEDEDELAAAAGVKDDEDEEEEEEEEVPFELLALGAGVAGVS